MANRPACTFDFCPVGRAAEAVVCKTTHVGATPTRDSIFSGIGVERHAPLAVRSTFQTGVKGALPSCPSNFRDTNPGAGQDFHRPGCGGSTPPSCRVRVANFDSEVPALNRRELGANPRRPTICASVVKLLSSSASNGEFAGGSPAGCTNSRACGSTRIAEGPDSESGSLGGAIPFIPTIYGDWLQWEQQTPAT